MASFRPSATVTLAIAVENYQRTITNQPSQGTQEVAPVQPPPSQAQLESQLSDIASQLEALEAERAVTAPNRYNRDRAALTSRRDGLVRQIGGNNSQADQAQNPPDALRGTSEESITIAFEPIDCAIQRAALTTADTATITFSAKDVPIDPRLIRSAGVEITIGIIDPGSFEAGIRGEQNNGVRRSIIQRSTRQGGPQTVSPDTTRFVGVIDDWTIKFGDDGDTISCQARDLSALLRDEPLAAGKTLSMTLPIQQAVQDMCDQYASLRGTRCYYGDPLLGGSGSTNGPTLQTVIATPRLGPRRGRQQQRQRSGDQNESVMDHIIASCEQLGFRAAFYDYELWIIDPRNHFAGRSVQRTMVYGQNLVSMEFSRKLAGTKVPTIECRSYDPTIGRTRWARYPVAQGEASSGIIGVSNPSTQPRRNSAPSPSGNADADRIQTIILAQGLSPSALQAAARSSNEQIGRQEIEGNFETAEVESFGAQTQVATGALPRNDLLQLDAGDAVEILIQGQAVNEAASTAAELYSLTRQARARYFESIGFAQSVAARLAALQDATAFQTVFRINNMQLNYSADDGIVIKADFVNFIEVAEQASQQDTTEPTSRRRPRHQSSTERPEDRTSTADQLAGIQTERDQLTALRRDGRITDEQYQQQLSLLDRDQQFIQAGGRLNGNS